MKKIVASVGLVALGASGLQAVEPAISADPSKPWSLSASLRGFYDDNINSLPDGATPVISAGGGLTKNGRRDSFGFEISPSAVVGWSLEQTSISLAYVFSYKNYENRPVGNADNSDFTHTFNASVDHAFNERYQASVKDSFVVGQEPDMLRAGNAYATFFRLPGDNIRNYGTINLDGQLTHLLGFELGYGNSYYDYANDDEAFVIANPQNGPTVAALLNRMENFVHLDSKWQIQPETVGVIGYQFRQVNYTADQTLDPANAGTPGSLVSKDRDNRVNYGYVGLDHTFSPTLTASVRLGASYSDYYNDPNGSTSVSPYALLSGRWTYLPESYVEVGFSHDRNATDLSGVQPLANGKTDFTLDSESSVAYVTVNHRITPKLYANIMGQFQDAEYNGGSVNNQSDKFFLIGLSFEYRFNRNLSAQAGYNYDKLDSDIAGRGFDRNRVYAGITATF